MTDRESHTLALVFKYDHDHDVHVQLPHSNRTTAGSLTMFTLQGDGRDPSFGCQRDTDQVAGTFIIVIKAAGPELGNDLFED